MSDDRFKLIFSGFIEGAEIDAAKAAIQERFQLRHDSIDQWFGVEHAAIQRDLTQDQAWKLQYVLESLGVEASVVLQPRSNLHLDRMEIIPQKPAKPRSMHQPAIQIRNYQPNGLAQFSSQPLSHGVTHRATPVRRRSVNRAPQQQPANESGGFKLTHFVAAAVLIVVVSIAGKQLLMPSGSMNQPVASLHE